MRVFGKTVQKRQQRAWTKVSTICSVIAVYFSLKLSNADYLGIAQRATVISMIMR